MTFPIQRVILPGFKEKKRTRAKKMAEKTRSAVLSEIWLPRTGWIPVVKEVVAHLGIAKTWSKWSDKADR